VNSDEHDIRSYLEIRTASPSGWSPDGRDLLIASDLTGTRQVHRLDVGELEDPPVPAEDLTTVTDLDEPTHASYLPQDPLGEDRHRLLVVTDQGGNERYQLYLTVAQRDEPVRDLAELDPLVVDPTHIHRPGAVTRDGERLAYTTNRRNGVAFDTWVLDLTTGSERCVFATGGWTGPGRFSPAGRWLAISELTERAGDNRLYLLEVGGAGRDEVDRDPAERGPEDQAPMGGEPLDRDPLGRNPESWYPIDREHAAVMELAPHDRPASVGAPSWLPDESAFFFSTDVDRDRRAIARGAPDGGWEHVIEPGWDASCAVDRSGRHLLVAWNEDGRTQAELRDPTTLDPSGPVPLPGEGVAGGFRFTRDGRYLAFSYSSPLIPGDTWRYDTIDGSLDRLTLSPCDVNPSTFVDAELIRYRSFDGLEVPAFVFRPRGPGPFPVVVRIHGGPESQYRPSFEAVTQYLVAHGFAVVAPNVRGSTGYGRNYQQLDDVDRRFDAVRDLAALHDWLADQPELDEERAALYGGSYGGYMVLAGLAFQPDRWAAGVDIVGISDLVTFLENTAPWRRAYREREYGSLEHDRELLESLSPIHHVDQMRAPLLIIHGANDPRVPVSEAEQIHRELRRRGITSELLVYEDEGHGLSKLGNRLDAYPRVASFLGDVLSG
jgi:dipeptidyl aminopeptidase/acylaminoacyl peptidase